MSVRRFSMIGIQVHLDPRAVLEGDLHDAAMQGRDLEVAGDVVAADHVEDDIGLHGLPGQLGDEILGSGS